MSKKALTLIIQGTPISPGLAQGIIHAHHGLLGPIDVPVAIEQNNVKEEFSRLDAATARISDDLSAWLRGWKRKSIPDWLRFSEPINSC